MVEPTDGGLSPRDKPVDRESQSAADSHASADVRRPTRIKGTREGLTITLGTDDLGSLLGELADHLERQGAFFRGGRVALELGDRPLTAEELTQLGALLERHEMILRTVVTSSQESLSAATALGLRVVETRAEPLSRPESMPTAGPLAEAATPETTEAAFAAPSAPLQAPPSPRVPDSDSGKGILINHVVRSGQVVRHSGHIVVIGDVHPGASVIAGGDIVIWGRLAGLAHAGSMGDGTAVVCALEMAPMQLRIGQLIARPEDRESDLIQGGFGARSRSRLGSRSEPIETPSPRSQPEIAHVQGDKIVVDAWDRLRRGV